MSAKVDCTWNCIQSYAPMTCLHKFWIGREIVKTLSTMPLWMVYGLNSIWACVWYCPTKSQNAPCESVQTTDWCWYIYIYICIHVFFVFLFEFLNLSRATSTCAIVFPPICTKLVFEFCTDKWKGLTQVINLWCSYAVTGKAALYIHKTSSNKWYKILCKVVWLTV